MKNLKHFFKICISVLLVFSVITLSCVNAFAASNQTIYISDLILCSADSAEEAKAELKSQGYQLMSQENLNVTLSDGLYIGYKTTSDPDEAITDIAAMDMYGNYSFSDYEVLLKNMKEDVSSTVNGLVPMISAYRANYKAGNALTVEIYGVLNKFCEDDSGKGMGDYLLTCDLKDTTDLTKVFMQGYGSFIVDIQQLLFLAGETDTDRNKIEEMASSDPDALVDMYVDSYSTPNRAYTALAKDYGTAADEIRSTWDVFYENLQAIVDEYFTVKDDEITVDEEAVTEGVDFAEEVASETPDEDMTDAELVENLQGNMNAAEICDNIADVNLINYLISLEYDDLTMLDFFMRPSDEVDDTELYTLAYYLGKDLTAQVGNVGLQQVISRIMVDGGNVSADKFTELNEAFAEIEQVSIYEGVDRSLFENGVALTGPTVEKYISSGKDWSDGLFDRVFQPTEEYKWADFFALYVLPTVVSSFVFASLFIANQYIQAYMVTATKAVLEHVSTVSTTVVKTAVNKLQVNLIFNAPEFSRDFSLGVLLYGKGLLGRSSLLYRIVAGVRCAFFAVSVILSVVSLVMLFVTIAHSSEDEAPEYEVIPSHIVDTVSTQYGDDYIAYNFVKNTQGSAADLNNYVSKNGWLVLYYTKDPMAGNPINADMKVVKGSADAPLNYENVSLFGQENAVNIASQDYTGVKDTANGIYLYFSRSTSASAAAGSAITGGYAAIAAGLGGVIGVVIGCLTAKAKSGRKKVEA